MHKKISIFELAYSSTTHSLYLTQFTTAKTDVVWLQASESWWRGGVARTGVAEISAIHDDLWIRRARWSAVMRRMCKVMYSHCMDIQLSYYACKLENDWRRRCAANHPVRRQYLSEIHAPPEVTEYCICLPPLREGEYVLTCQIFLA